MKKLIAPSILSANFAHLGDEVKNVLAAGADIIHFDVMDNHYVPNLTIGPAVLQSLRDDGISAPIDVHLMVQPVDSMIEAFAKAGASMISFHPEASDDVAASLALIKQYNIKAGLALNPDIALDTIADYWEDIDLLLLMSVFPGFGGQQFINDVLTKIADARQVIDDKQLNIILEVDGGIKVDNIGTVAEHGANAFVAGSAIFNTNDYAKVISQMREKMC